MERRQKRAPVRDSTRIRQYEGVDDTRYQPEATVNLSNLRDSSTPFHRKPRALVPACARVIIMTCLRISTQRVPYLLGRRLMVCPMFQCSSCSAISTPAPLSQPTPYLWRQTATRSPDSHPPTSAHEVLDSPAYSSAIAHRQ